MIMRFAGTFGPEIPAKQSPMPGSGSFVGREPQKGISET